MASRIRQFFPAAVIISVMVSPSCLHRRVEPPLTVLLVGDSIMAGYLGYMLQNRLNDLPGVTAIRRAKKSTGLAEYKPYDWPGKTTWYVKRYKPDIVIALFGANDCLLIRQPDGTSIQFEDEKWETAYASLVREYLAGVPPSVDKIFLLAQPASSHPFLRERLPAANAIFQKESRRFPRVTFVPLDRWTTKRGRALERMSDVEGSTENIHFPKDPVHHSLFGGKVLAEKVIDYMQRKGVRLPKKE